MTKNLFLLKQACLASCTHVITVVVVLFCFIPLPTDTGSGDEYPWITEKVQIL